MKGICVNSALRAGFIVCLIFSNPVSAETKTITRVDDPIVIECRDFAPLFGAPIESLSLMTLNGGTWSPVPFQIDEKKPDGEYAFTAGPMSSNDPDSNLDANDELVFMIKDIGGSSEAEAPPEGALAGVEIEITDPKDGKKGWAYLFRFPGKAPRSGIDYVSIDEKALEKNRDRIVTEHFVTEKNVDKCYPDFMARINPDGGMGPDLLDRFKIREVIMVPSLNLSWAFDLEEMITVKNLAWIDGPVRVMYLTKNNVQVTTFITVEAPSYTTSTYYLNQSITPIVYEQPRVSGIQAFITSAMMKIIPDDRMDAYIDFTPAVYGARFFSSAHPIREDVVADGRMSETEKALDLEARTDWVAAQSKYGGVVFRGILPDIFDDTPPRLLYVDDKDRNDPPESDQGMCAIGYSLHRISKKFSDPDKATGMVIRLYVYSKPDLKEENVPEILDILDHPVQVDISRISSTDDAATE